MSWNSVKTLNTHPETWGMWKRDYFKTRRHQIMLKNILKRCGRFLTYIVYDKGYNYERLLNKNIVSLIKKSCPNLQVIDIPSQRCRDINDIRTIVPIFDKVKKFEIMCLNIVDNDNLKYLFSLNNQLESLNITFKITIHTNFLDVLPHKTMKELEINGKGIRFSTIHHVSLTFGSLNFSNFMFFKKFN